MEVTDQVLDQYYSDFEGYLFRVSEELEEVHWRGSTFLVLERALAIQDWA